MNIVFIQGKIITDIQFEFIINNKNISIAIFKIQLLNKSIVTVKSYNKLADITKYIQFPCYINKIMIKYKK